MPPRPPPTPRDRPRPTQRSRRGSTDIVATANNLRRDGASVGDLKIVAGAFKEMRRAFKVFAPYRHIRKVSTFGSARTQPGDPVFQLREAFARRVADRGFMVITGAGPASWKPANVAPDGRAASA